MATPTNFFDDASERGLLGAAMLNAAAIDTALETGVDAASFYDVAHGFIFDAITTLHGEGAAVDVITVADRLQQTDQLQRVGGPPELVALISECPATSHAHTYAKTVVGYARDRYVWAELSTMLNGSFPTWRERTQNLIDTVDGWDAATDEPLQSDLAAWLAGDIEPVYPELITRDDGDTMLLYRPGLTWLMGEPGKGKTLVAQWWALSEMVAGRHVVYIDHEGTEQSLLARLTQMGATPDVIIEHLYYLNRRGEPWSNAALAQLRAMLAAIHPSLVVIDAVAGAMEAEGLDPELNRDVEKWSGGIPAVCAAAGAATVAIDHLTKNVETRNGYAIGAQRKKGIADAAYELVMRTDAGIGTKGYGKLVIRKDRHGALEQKAQAKTIADVTITSEDDGEGGYLLSLMFAAPPAVNQSGRPRGFEPTWYMEEVSRAVETHTAGGGITKTALRALVGSTAKYVDKAIVLLEDAGHIREADVKGSAKPYVSVSPYRRVVDHPPLDEDVPVRSFYEPEVDAELF